MNQTIQNLHSVADYIEVNLKHPIKIEKLANLAGYSSWHFQRVFRSLTGDSVNKYVLGRRMTVAAQEILEGKELIDLTFDYQFSSQEAFSRAFKRYHGCAPGKYKKLQGQNKNSVRKLKITEAYLKQIHQGETMHPEIIQLKAKTIIGLRASFNGAMADEPNNHDVIPNLWKDFHQRIGEIRQRVGTETLGVIFPDPKNEGRENLHEKLIYIAGVEVKKEAEVPIGMEVFLLPEFKYAAFTHQGQVKEIDKTLNYVFGTWLPQSNYLSPNQANLEIFPENYNPLLEASKMSFLIPIQ